MRILRTLGVGAVLAVVLGGCQSMRDGGTDEPVPTTPGVQTPGAEPPAEPPAEPGAPVLQIDVSGGFVPVGWDFSVVPQLTIYSDGRAIVHGPQILIYPGPALPNLQVSTADVDALITAARDAGLLAEPPDYGQPPIADVPTTFVTLRVDGQVYRHAAYALDPGPVPDEFGLTDEQVAARTALAEFVADANDLVATDSEPYAIQAFGFFAWPASEGGADPEPEPEVLPWPLDLALADATECTLVEAPDTATLLETLERASQTTRFSQDTIYDVFFRPLLPHETGCADL